MGRAVELAEAAQHRAAPNPTVGAVLVKENDIVAYGVTEPLGGRHAEVVCIDDARARHVDMTDTTLYVTLEPCGHHGRTPPCSDAIIEAGIPRVRYGVDDAHPAVSGEGLRALGAAGVDAKQTSHQDVIHACEALHRSFRHKILTGRPYVILKTAASLDGSMALSDGTSNWITSQASREKVHAIRANVSALVTGHGTIQTDNPRMTVRHVQSERHPQIYACLGSSRSNTKAHVFEKIPGRAETQVFITGEDGRVDLVALLGDVAKDGHHLVLIEAGPTLSRSFLNAGLVDEWWHFVAPKWLNGKRLFEAPVLAMSASSCFDDIIFNGSVGRDMLFVGPPRERC